MDGGRPIEGEVRSIDHTKKMEWNQEKRRQKGGTGKKMLRIRYKQAKEEEGKKRSRIIIPIASTPRS